MGRRAPAPRRSAGPLTPVAEAAGAAAAAVFGALSAVRRRRIFHPVGTAYDAVLQTRRRRAYAASQAARPQ